jgi:16S rRNA U516 pseudouridylate synthase RsuA-like enzyme
MAQERAQKILAQAGCGSRRGCEKMIKSGLVTINSNRIKLGDKADPQTDEIRLSC